MAILVWTQEVIERDRDKGDEQQSAMTLLEVGFSGHPNEVQVVLYRRVLQILHHCTLEQPYKSTYPIQVLGRLIQFLKKRH